MNQGMQTGIERSRPQLGKGGGAGKEEREGRGNVHGVIQARHFQHMSRGPVVRAVCIHQDPVIAPSFLIRPLPPSLPPCSVFCGIQDSTQGQRLSAPSSAVHSLLSPRLHALGGRRNGKKNKMKKGACEELGREDPFFLHFYGSKRTALFSSISCPLKDSTAHVFDSETLGSFH